MTRAALSMPERGRRYSEERPFSAAFRELPRIETELLQQRGVVLVIDLRGKLLNRLLNLVILASFL